MSERELHRAGVLTSVTSGHLTVTAAARLMGVAIIPDADHHRVLWNSPPRRMGGPAAGSGLSAGVFDALRVKVRDEGIVRNKAVHIALGVRAETKLKPGRFIDLGEHRTAGYV